MYSGHRRGRRKQFKWGEAKGIGAGRWARGPEWGPALCATKQGQPAGEGRALRGLAWPAASRRRCASTLALLGRGRHAQVLCQQAHALLHAGHALQAGAQAGGRLQFRAAVVMELARGTAQCSAGNWAPSAAPPSTAFRDGRGSRSHGKQQRRCQLPSKNSIIITLSAPWRAPPASPLPPTG